MSKPSRTVKVNMSGIETFVKAEEGQHVAVLKEADIKKSSNGDDMVTATFEITKGPSTGARVYENFPLIDTALWKLKSYLDAIGVKSDGKIIVDLDKMEGKVCIIEVEHEEYKGKTKASITGYKNLKNAKAIPEDDEDDDDDDEEDEEEEEVKVKPSNKKKAPKKPVIEEEDDEEDEEEEEPAPKKKTKKKAPVVEEDEDEDDEEDEEEEVKKPAKKSKKPETKKAKKKPVDDDDDEDEEWDEE